MSDSEERSATANVSDSEDLSTTLEGSPSSYATYESSSRDQSTSPEGSLSSVDTCESSSVVQRERDAIFICSFSPAKYLKFAIDVLSNLEVSSNMSGRIDVDNNGFNITVQNLGNCFLGHLHLKPATFRCTKPLNDKIFSFLELCLELAVVQDEATVYLSNCSSTDRLDITVLLDLDLQNATVKYSSFSVPMSYASPEICKFPDLSSLFFTATVPSVDFSDMILHLLPQKEPQVSVDIKDNSATLRAGKDNPWTATYAMLRADESSAMEEGTIYSASFEWTNANITPSLQKASKLDSEFVVLFHAEQPKSIILRFNLGNNVGYLEFMKNCSMTKISLTRSQ